MRALLLTLALCGCATAPPVVQVAPVCVTSLEDDSTQKCPEPVEAPPKTDEACVEVVQSTTLNHTPPTFVPFCSPREAVEKVRHQAGKRP